MSEELKSLLRLGLSGGHCPPYLSTSLAISGYMLNKMVNYYQRTQEEIDLTNFYLDKWDKILYSTQPVDRSKAEKAIVNAYHYLGLSAPEIYFLTSPSPEQCSNLKKTFPDNVHHFVELKRDLRAKLVEELKDKPHIENADLYLLYDNYRVFNISQRGEIFNTLCGVLYGETIYNYNLPNANFYKLISFEAYRTNAWFYDLCVERITRTIDLEIWNIIKILNIECPYLITYDGFCIIIEKPCELNLNPLMLPHADGKAAVRYTDGYEIYCYHGLEVLAKYGKVCSGNWQAQWILNEQQSPTSRQWHHHEELGTALRLGLGYKSFYEQLPTEIDVYWKTNVNGHWKENGHPDWSHIMGYAYHQIIFEWILFYYYDYYKGNTDFDWRHSDSNLKYNIAALSLYLSQELDAFDVIIYEGNHPLAPGLCVHSFAESSQNLISGLSDRPALKLFSGDRDEIYYAICSDTQETFSTIYCKLPGKEPVVYAECLTSLIVAIAQCYQEGAYYLSIDPKSGERKIEQDLDKVEPIFEKFNPNQIDAWRSIWKEA